MRIATAATQLFLLVMLTRVSGMAAGDETHTIVLTVTEPTGDARRGWPVTSGVPFGQGVLWDGDSTALIAANGDQLPLQTEVLSRWADGSVRWLLLDFAVDLRPHEKQTLTLRHGSSVRRAPVADGVRVVSSEDSVVLRTGPMQSILSLKHFRLLDDVRLDRNQDGEFSEDERVTSSSNAGIMLRTPDGETFTADQATAQATVEQDGPLRACVRWEGQHASHQGTMFRYVLRIHAFRGQPFLKMHYTFINDYQSELMAKIDSLALTFSLRDAEQVTYVTDGKLSSGGRLFQLDDRSYAIDGRSAGQRAHGWIAQGNATTGMAVGLREFWQNWPKGLQQNPGMLQVEICPDFLSGQYDEKPLEEECQLYYYLRGGVYSFKIGVARTHELWATFFPGAPDVARLTEFFEATEKPLLAQCAPEYIGTTEAMGRFPPADPGRFGGYDHWMNLFFDQHLADRDRFREYGMLNNGDWYNTNWDSWGNLEYDTSRIWFLQYLRTGDRRYFDRAEQAVQHYIDVDIVHAVNPMVQAYPGSINMQPGQIWAHSVGHTGGYYARYVNEKYEDEAPLRQKGAPQVGFWDHGHVWIGGVFDAYLLTGDRRAREVGVLASDDDRGRQVCEACHTADLAVPDEVAVVGVDNDDLLCELADPPLSSVALDSEQAGWDAAALLDRMMRGEKVKRQRILVAPTGVVVRRSSDARTTGDLAVTQAVRFIHDNASRGIGVNDVVAAVGGSRRTLEVRFRKTLRRAVNAEIQRAKIERATRLLAETDLSVDRIARAAGFRTSGYLIRLFSREHGIPPGTYRRKIRGDERDGR